MKIVRYADHPELRERRFAELTRRTFPEYMTHNEPGGLYWGRLYDVFPDFQVALVDGDELLAEAHAVPFAWDGTLDDLPAGWDEGFVRAMTSERAPTAVMALAISVAPERQGERLSGRMVQAFRDCARAAGLGTVLAPVRPTLKERYPLIPIERYMTWRRSDGAHFDPWLRLHERVGGRILAPAPESMVIDAPAGDWASWTGLELPADGDYTFPRGLAPLAVRGGVGRHVEPNVWVQHDV